MSRPSHPSPVEVDVLLGTCGPAVAVALRAHGATHTLRTTAETTEGAVRALEHRVDAGAATVAWACSPATRPHDVLALFADGQAPARLGRLIVVVDAAHLLRDLGSATQWVDAEAWGRSGREPLAAVTVHQIEYADVLTVVGWHHLRRPELAQVLGLLNHLNPRARLLPWRGARAWRSTLAAATTSTDRTHPGWAEVLNGEHHPHMTGYGVGAHHDEQLRPFHPERLLMTLESGFEHAHGRMLVSAGFCRLASRYATVSQWRQVGPSITALDACALTDAELAAGPEAWAAMPDPLPAWNPTR